ncbi:SCO2522 family protein [Nocardia sp. NPDC058658]|uniref:SCO2522 family protein n=1 Tax=Nocardia sp. NPDC058658 TaxID=3346580 RepID=UPI00364DE89A
MSSLFQEATADSRIEAVSMSHVSIEIGHFSMDELANGTDKIVAQLAKVAPLVHFFTEQARDEFADRAGNRSAVRVSTCFLVDDYFRGDTDPREILPRFLRLVGEAGIELDYLGRESGCAFAPRPGSSSMPIRLARVVADMVVAAPLPGYDGRRPPTSELGWLANGARSSDYDQSRARNLGAYLPPEQLAARNHSIHLDVEMWRGNPERETEPNYWSCPFLASVWQLLRLGMLRYAGGPVAQPQNFTDWRPDTLPDRWSMLPAVMQLRQRAKPFAAYRSLSVLPKRYLPVEHSVQQVLDHVNIEPGVREVFEEQARRDRMPVPHELSDRLAHFFLSEY